MYENAIIKPWRTSFRRDTSRSRKKGKNNRNYTPPEWTSTPRFLLSSTPGIRICNLAATTNKRNSATFQLLFTLWLSQLPSEVQWRVIVTKIARGMRKKRKPTAWHFHKVEKIQTLLTRVVWYNIQLFFFNFITCLLSVYSLLSNQSARASKQWETDLLLQVLRAQTHVHQKQHRRVICHFPTWPPDLHNVKIN